MGKPCSIGPVEFLNAWLLVAERSGFPLTHTAQRHHMRDRITIKTTL